MSDALIRRIRALSRPLTAEPAELPAQVRPLSSVRVILFDVVGTLFLSRAVADDPYRSSGVMQACEAALCAIGLQEKAQTLAERMANLLPQTLDHHLALRREDGVLHPDADLRAVWRDIHAQLELSLDPARLDLFCVEAGLRLQSFWPMPGVKETLLTLRESGLRLGVVASAPFYAPLVFNALLESSMDDLGFEPDLRIWGWQELRGKPDVSLFLRLVDYLWRKDGIPPEQVLHVGSDMLGDVWAAHEAGLRTALFTGDKPSLCLREDIPQCEDIRPDLVLPDLFSLLDAVGLRQTQPARS